MSQFLAMAAEQGDAWAKKALKEYIAENPNIFEESRAWLEVEKEEQAARARKVKAHMRKTKSSHGSNR